MYMKYIVLWAWIGYYRIFVEGFLKIVNPITKLQKKNKKFIWME
jgi:hypothetical protein